MSMDAARSLPAEQPRLTLLAFAGLVVLIGSNLVSIRYTNREIDPFWNAGARFFIATILFVALMAWLRVPWPNGRALLGALLYGATAIAAYFALIYWGLVEVKAGHGQTLLSLAPLLTLLFAIGQGLERFRWNSLLGAIVASAGVVVVFGEQVSADVPVLSVLAIVLAAACFAEGSIIMKLLPPASIVSANAVAMGVGAVSLLLVSFASGEEHAMPDRPMTWVAFGYLSTVGTVGTFLLLLYVLRHWTASAAAYQFVAAPLVAVALAALLLDESVSPAFFAGAALVLAGVYIGAIRSQRRSVEAGGGVGAT
jgi:drug/metabolite transporter (DMT)-like permease